MNVTYPLLTVADDSGVVVTGATVTIASVTDLDGSAIASHGAVLHMAGANISVVYDAETKGEAWITLAVSKTGSVISGLNAAPAFFLARDSSRIDTNISTAKLAADGLDSIASTAPANRAAATSFPKLLMFAARFLFNTNTRNKSTGAEIVYADDDSATLATRTSTDDGTVQRRTKAS